MSEKPYKLIHDDCLAAMREMADKSVDLCLTDPPYGKKASKGTNGFGDSANRKYSDTWDSQRPPQEYFDELRRVSKNVIIFGGNYFADLLPPSNCWLVWDKKGAFDFENPFADCELIWTSFNGVVKKYNFIQQGFVTEASESRFHPTQKPVKLVQMLVRDFSKVGDTILDPFMGSGTTGIACLIEKRKFIGVERDEHYFKIAEARIRRANLEPCDIPRRQIERVESLQSPSLFG